jgi:regulatory protein
MAKKLNEKALGYSLRLLKIRLRSSQELRNKLKSRNYKDCDIEAVLDYLMDLGEINDELFAKCWIEDRMHLNPRAPFALQIELKKKGISSRIIEKHLELLKNKYDFNELALDLARGRLNTFKKGLEAGKAKKRIFDFLSRRGFEAETIYEVIGELF